MIVGIVRKREPLIREKRKGSGVDITFLPLAISTPDSFLFAFLFDGCLD